MEITFKKGANGNKLIFPLTSTYIKDITSSGLVNPCPGKDHGIKVPSWFDIEESTYEIVHLRHLVAKGIYPTEFLLKYWPFDFPYTDGLTEPLKSEGLSKENPEGLANVVHMDLPSQAPNACLRYLLKNENVKDWTKDYKNFLESIPFVQEQITDGIKRGLIKSFDVKYYYGLARPEEVYYSVTKIPGKFLTAYPEGCPAHPSYPAGHSGAVAGGVISLIKEFNIQDEKHLQEVLKTAYLWGMFRSLAGVHHAVDNVAGLIVGGLKKYIRKDVLKDYLK